MKMQRWQENRELIQGNFDELSERYDKLKELTNALVDLNALLAKGVMRTAATGIRPGEIKNALKKVNQLKDQLP